MRGPRARARAQVLFRLPPGAALQLVAFSAPAGRYEALREPHALEAAQLALPLPAPAALAALSLAPRGQALNGPGALAQLAAAAAAPAPVPEGAGAAPAQAQADGVPGPAGSSDPAASAAEGLAASAPSQPSDAESEPGTPSPARGAARSLAHAPSSPRTPGGRRVAAIVDEWPPLPPTASVRQLWAQYQAAGQQQARPPGGRKALQRASSAPGRV